MRAQLVTEELGRHALELDLLLDGVVRAAAHAERPRGLEFDGLFALFTDVGPLGESEKIFGFKLVKRIDRRLGWRLREGRTVPRSSGQGLRRHESRQGDGAHADRAGARRRMKMKHVASPRLQAFNAIASTYQISANETPTQQVF